MDMRPETFAPATPDLSPVVERVFSEPGRISEAVFVSLDFAEGDAAALAECAGIYESSTLALIAAQLGRRLARIRRELETARAGEASRA